MMNTALKHCLSCFALSLFVVVPGYGQRFWENKSYKQWTDSEVMKILTNSPWAQTRFESGQYELPGYSYEAMIRLRSALPVRQAVVRQRMLFVNYDKLSAADQARFDAEVKEFLECRECGSYYIVTLKSPSGTVESEPTKFDILWSLRNLSLDELKPYVYLANEKGDKRELIRFTPPKRVGADAMFVSKDTGRRERLC
jgi:hypothetical protein